MALTMDKILDRFNDCDMFSLTGGLSRYNITISNEEVQKEISKIEPKDRNKYLEKYLERYTITEEDFNRDIIDKQEREIKEKNRKLYEKIREKNKNYPQFDVLYEEIKTECYDFNSKENREYYINKHFTAKKIDDYKKLGFTDEHIENMKKDFFRASFIADEVGKTTKYGKENKGFFWNFYYNIATIIDLQNSKEKYCVKNGKSPVEQVPEELKKHLLYYELSTSNAVTIGGIMINYYFKLNNETKNYLLKFRNDFCLEPLDDLTLYKDDQIKFYSCTHEVYNSIDIDYKKMTKEEIEDFVNDELFEEENKKEIIEIINKLIDMKTGTIFSSEEIGITSKNIKVKVYEVCAKLNLQLFSSTTKKKNGLVTVENGTFTSLEEVPAVFCELDDLIEKKY